MKTLHYTSAFCQCLNQALLAHKSNCEICNQPIIPFEESPEIELDRFEASYFEELDDFICQHSEAA